MLLRDHMSTTCRVGHKLTASMQDLNKSAGDSRVICNSPKFKAAFTSRGSHMSQWSGAGGAGQGYGGQGYGQSQTGSQNAYGASGGQQQVRPPLCLLSALHKRTTCFAWRGGSAGAAITAPAARRRAPCLLAGEPAVWLCGWRHRTAVSTAAGAPLFRCSGGLVVLELLPTSMMSMLLRLQAQYASYQQQQAPSAAAATQQPLYAATSQQQQHAATGYGTTNASSYGGAQQVWCLLIRPQSPASHPSRGQLPMKLTATGGAIASYTGLPMLLPSSVD